MGSRPAAATVVEAAVLVAAPAVTVAGHTARLDNAAALVAAHAEAAVVPPAAVAMFVFGRLPNSEHACRDRTSRRLQIVQGLAATWFASGPAFGPPCSKTKEFRFWTSGRLGAGLVQCAKYALSGRRRRNCPKPGHYCRARLCLVAEDFRVQTLRRLGLFVLRRLRIPIAVCFEMPRGVSIRIRLRPRPGRGSATVAGLDLQPRPCAVLVAGCAALRRSEVVHRPLHRLGSDHPVAAKRRTKQG
jgi:hypothetical protein